MSRTRRLAITILPAVLAGGLLFGTAFGYASSDDDDAWDVDPGADGDDPGHRAPGRRTADSRGLPPAPPAPPVPPAPPAPPGGWSQPPPMPGKGGRFSVSIRDGKVHLDGLEGFARHHLDAVRDLIRNHPSISPDVRDKVLARLDKARAIIERRVRGLQTADLDKIGGEMDKMGEELEAAMEGLEDELEQLGDKLGKDLARRLGRDLARSLRPGIRIDPRDHDRDRDRRRGRDPDPDDGDGDHAIVVGPDADLDADSRGAIRDLPDLTLKPAQRAQIVKLRSSYEQQIAVARKQLDDASRRLEIALADPRTSDADIARYVDQVSSHEAAIRKARLLTWVNARRLLDDEQRQKIEDAAGKRHR